jgi:hypothetical protein
MKKIYLATSYSYKTKNGMLRNLSWFAKFIMWVRYRRVTRATAHFLVEGVITGAKVNIFSPITHSHPLPKYIPRRLDTHSMWLGLDFQWIDCCDEMWIYMQPGWAESYGVEQEIRHCRQTDKIIRFFDYKTYKEVDSVSMLDTLD